ncbi:MAG: hypothetical protein JNL08_09985 [Planctomycetes bacterium]|nr:hypothetical protein [Planctomycetota bacterium]
MPVSAAVVFALVGALYSLQHELEHGREPLLLALLLPAGIGWLQVFH